MSDNAATSKAHPVLYALTFIGFSGVITLAAFCAKVGAGQEQLQTVVATEASTQKTVAELVKMEAVDQYHLNDLDKQVDKLQERK